MSSPSRAPLLMEILFTYPPSIIRNAFAPRTSMTGPVSIARKSTVPLPATSQQLFKMSKQWARPKAFETGETADHRPRQFQETSQGV